MTTRPTSRRDILVTVVTLALTAAAPLTAHAQIVVKAGDDVNFRLGILGQFQGDTLEDPSADSNINNLFIRRIRLLFGGQVTKNVTFFVETDSANLGKATPCTTAGCSSKSIASTTIIQDAYGEFKANQMFAVDAGLMFVPFSHNSVQSAASLLPIDYGAYTFSQSGPTQSSVGRDTGFQAKGYFLGDHLEYRIGAFQGVRDQRSHNGFRYVGRVMYNFLDPEVGFFYTGTYLGKKRIASVAAAFDTQKSYHAYDVDAFVDLPAGPAGAFTGQFDYNRFDGDVTLASLKKQNDVLVEAGYFIKAAKLTPVVQFAKRSMVNTSTGDENRWSVGANYWWAGHNANIKAAVSRINPTGTSSQNEFTVQLQLFYF